MSDGICIVIALVVITGSAFALGALIGFELRDAQMREVLKQIDAARAVEQAAVAQGPTDA